MHNYQFYFMIAKQQLTSTQFTDLNTSFKAWVKTMGYSQSSQYEFPRALNEFFQYLEQNQIYSIEEIKEKNIEDFFAHLRLRPNQRREGGLSVAYLKKYSQALKNFFRYISLTRNIHISFQIKFEKSTSQVSEFLSNEEIYALFDSCENTPYGIRDRCMLSILYGCGLRRNEALNLDLSDIDFERRIIHVRKAKGYKERVVPITKKVMLEIEHYIDSGRPYLLTKNKTNLALFITQRGTRIQGQSLMKRLKLLVRRLGSLSGRKIGLHTLRHSIASHLIQGSEGKKGMDFKKVGKFLGHSNSDSTMIYAHLRNEGI